MYKNTSIHSFFLMERHLTFEKHKQAPKWNLKE